MVITTSRLPETYAQFTELVEQYPLTLPEHTTALFVYALNLYLANREDGWKAIDLLRGPRPMNGYDKQFLADRFRGKTYLARAYYENACPENNYEPSRPYTIVVSDPQRTAEPGYTYRTLSTAGADTPRPIRLRQKPSTGEWFLWEYSTILNGISLPQNENSWN